VKRASIIRWPIAAAVLAAAVALGGCGSVSKLSGSTTPTGRVSPLTNSIGSFLHALSIDQLECGRAASRRARRSCQVEFTDTYGEWWATLVVAGSRVVSDPGGVADWLCATSCANPPAMTANTGNPRNNPGFTAATGSTGHGQTGVTGATGVVKLNDNGRPKSVTGATGNGVVYATGSTGAPAATGTSGPAGTTGKNGVVYGTGSTGAPAATGTSGVAGTTGPNGVVYGTGSTGPGAPGAGR